MRSGCGWTEQTHHTGKKHRKFWSRHDVVPHCPVLRPCHKRDCSAPSGQKKDSQNVQKNCCSWPLILWIFLVFLFLFSSGVVCTCFIMFYMFRNGSSIVILCFFSKELLEQPKHRKSSRGAVIRMPRQHDRHSCIFKLKRANGEGRHLHHSNGCTFYV